MTTASTPFFRSQTGSLVYFADPPTSWGNVNITALEIAE